MPALLWANAIIKHNLIYRSITSQFLVSSYGLNGEHPKLLWILLCTLANVYSAHSSTGWTDRVWFQAGVRGIMHLHSIQTKLGPTQLLWGSFPRVNLHPISGMVALYLHPSTCFHHVVLNYLCTGTSLPFLLNISYLLVQIYEDCLHRRIYLNKATKQVEHCTWVDSTSAF
jgi:hypothetical protein